MVRLTRQQGVPVITVDGQVVLGFNRRRLEELLAKAPPSAPTLGAAVADAQRWAQMAGAYVGTVRPGSPAASAGLTSGDVIVEIGGRPVNSAAALQQIIARLRAGDHVSIVYLRAGQRAQRELRL